MIREAAAPHIKAKVEAARALLPSGIVATPDSSSRRPARPRPIKGRPTPHGFDYALAVLLRGGYVRRRSQADAGTAYVMHDGDLLLVGPGRAASEHIGGADLTATDWAECVDPEADPTNLAGCQCGIYLDSGAPDFDVLARDCDCVKER